MSGVAHSARTLAFLLALAGPPLGPPQQPVLFGHVASLVRSGAGYLMKVDPALLLTGKTASDYAFAKTGSRDVPNDNLYFDPEHTLLTYRVPATARASFAFYNTMAEVDQLVAGIRRVQQMFA